MPARVITPPGYILVIPQEDDVPEIQASCDKDSIDDLKELKQKGWYIYKLVGRKPCPECIKDEKEEG